ncbi:MAG: hypothetical protein M3162_01535 [Thermoproteota archaeon]|nr:hypothetical protein [Thermoproteota archaeon]
MPSPKEDNNNSGFILHLKYLVALLLAGIITCNLLIIFSEPNSRHAVSLIVLGTCASVATALGVVVVYRYGLKDNHGKSFLFLTLGIGLWLIADLSVMYLYFVIGLEDQNQVYLPDVFWLSGYLFLILHLVYAIKSISVKKLSITLVTILVIIVGFIIFNFFHYISLNLFDDIPKDFLAGEGEGYTRMDLVVTILYPILDLSLMVPSVLILVSLFHIYQHSIPWILSSLSLLINSMADIGYSDDFVRGSPGSWEWDLFYISDFIVMAGALYWYNKFHVPNSMAHEERHA